MTRHLFLLVTTVGVISGILPPGLATAAESIAPSQPEYTLGDTAVIYGQGFAPNSSVVVEVIRADNTIVTGDGTETPGSDTVTANSSGAFTYYYLLDGGPPSAYNGTLTVNAKDASTLAILATTTFLDSTNFLLQGCSRARGECTLDNPATGWANGASPMTGWTSGNLQGWFELEDVPYRLRIGMRDSGSAGTYYIMNEHDNLRSGVAGIDYASNFYVGAGPGATGYVEGQLTKTCTFQAVRLVGDIPTTSNPCIVTGPTYTEVNDDGDGATDEETIDGADNDGDGKIDEDPARYSGGASVRQIQYVWAVLFNSSEAGGSGKKWALYWTGHLAAGSHNFPGSSLHTHTTATGNQDVPISDVEEAGPSGADLAITKTDSPDPVLVGQNLTYTITVTNNGPSTATAVTVTDTLPIGVTFVSATASVGSCALSGGTITCSLGDLANGASATVTIVVTPTMEGTLSNTGIVSSTTSDPTPGNNTAGPVTTTVNPNADLSITKSDSPDPVLVGQNLTYTITVTNNGPSDAAGVTVTDTLPAGVTFVSATPSQGTCSGTSTVTCNLGTVPYPGSATVTIVVTPTAAGTLNNSASVSSSTNDPNTGNNNSGTVSTTVNAPSADLSITKSDSPDPVQVGGTLTYTITVSNAGPNTANSVTVTDTLPGSVTLISATPSQGSCSGSTTITCNLGSLASGASATVTIMVTPNASGTIGNSASVSSTTNDPNTGNNNSGTINTTVNPASPASADLAITKSDNPDPVDVGLQVTYTLTVTNNGPDGATGVTLTDTLPSGVTFNSATPSQGTCGTPSGGVFTCSLGSLGNGANASVTVVVTTTTAGMIANTASVSATQSDPNTANNSAMETTNVGDVARLINISTRGFVQTGDNVMIGGFVVGGNLPKALLVRARGRSLSAFGIAGTMADPFIELFSGSTMIARNDNWQTTDPLCVSPAVACGTATDIQNTGKSPCAVTATACTLDSAIYITLPPGPYTVILRGVGGGTGVGIVEVIDTDGSTLPKLVNISTRGLVLTGDSVMIGGFVIGAGATPKTILVRVRGPSLANFGVVGAIANPYVELYSGSTKIAQNDDWQTTDPLCLSPAVACGDATDIQNTGRDPCSVTTTGCTLDSSIYVTLPPGPYTAIVRGVSNGTGVAIVEILDISP